MNNYLHLEVVEKNLHSLYMYPGGNFGFKKNGKLIHIPQWNLGGRAFKWMQNICTQGKISKECSRLIYSTFENAYERMKQGELLTMHIPGAGYVGKGGAWLWSGGYTQPTALYVKEIAADTPLNSREDISTIVSKILNLFDFSEIKGISDAYDFAPFENKLKCQVFKEKEKSYENRIYGGRSYKDNKTVAEK